MRTAQRQRLFTMAGMVLDGVEHAEVAGAVYDEAQDPAADRRAVMAASSPHDTCSRFGYTDARVDRAIWT